MDPSPRWSLRRLTALAQRIEDRLTLPVVIAVCASIPAVFLTVWSDGQFVVAGKILGWAAGAVLWVETVILLLAAENKRKWLMRHKWLLCICALTFVSLVAAAGGAQILRLFYVIGSIRVLRAKRIITAAQVLNRRFGLGLWWRSALFGTAGIISAIFVAVVLADPTSEYINLVSWFDHNLQIVPILVAGAILAFSTWLVVRGRAEAEEEEE
ncbi:hypothetical protein L0U85_01160 [Glycomyces sp. L485]|uniref:hypothetical protein n=1 Tax=Glycomyces sp. L485 TaxID=2909235 RepID=UPI001F4A8002|nr:hypothetical protein [Glycomyces sp. L485]MCH7229476.1 hypothetical protein [Glycomyces sp. L485]